MSCPLFFNGPNVFAAARESYALAVPSVGAFNAPVVAPRFQDLNLDILAVGAHEKRQMESAALCVQTALF
jgi:hypothetical protein